MNRCKEVNERFFETAKASGEAEREMAVSAEQLFAALEHGPTWSKWVPVIRSIDWTSAKPYGVGTTRTAHLMAGIELDEVFWAWENERRIGFYVTATNNPTLAALAECYDITKLSDTRCKLRWRMAMELKGPLRMLEKYMRASLGPAMLKMLAKLEREAATFPRTQRAPAPRVAKA